MWPSFQHAVYCWPGKQLCLACLPVFSQSFKNLLEARLNSPMNPALISVGGVTFSSVVFFSFSSRPIMLYQIPWPLELSGRWILYMPLLNVNNHSLTSTSEYATRSSLYSHQAYDMFFLYGHRLIEHFCSLDLWDASISTRTKTSQWPGEFCAYWMTCIIYFMVLFRGNNNRIIFLTLQTTWSRKRTS